MDSILKYDTLPRSLTSYDVLKTVAVVLMIIDHVGHFFYPEEMWFRVFGRMCVPIWFFLIGYAKTKGVPLTYLLGGVVLAFASWAFLGHLFPLNILLVLMLYRMIIHEVMMRALKDYEGFFGVGLILVILAYPSVYVLDYGTYALFFVMFGYIMRHRDKIEIKPWVFWLYFFGVGFGFAVMQAMLLPTITGLQFAVMAGGVMAVMWGLYIFKSVTYEKMNGAKIWALQLFGRRTMEIYVLHFLAFTVVSLMARNGVISVFGNEVLRLDQVGVFFS
jgi:hypothetical protein